MRNSPRVTVSDPLRRHSVLCRNLNHAGKRSGCAETTARAPRSPNSAASADSSALRSIERNLAPHSPSLPKTRFGERNRQPAIAHIVRRKHRALHSPAPPGNRSAASPPPDRSPAALPRQFHESSSHIRDERKFASQRLRPSLAPARSSRPIEQTQSHRLRSETRAQRAFRILEQSQHAQNRRRINRLAQSLVVETDVPAGDRRRRARGKPPRFRQSLR